MKIVRIRTRNFLILTEIDLALNSKLNMFAGKNKAGKSALIKAIETACEGSTDTSLIQNGTDRAEILIELDDGMTIQRIMTRKGQRLQVTTGDGDKKAHPQEFINGLLGSFAFDPIAFILSKDKDRKKYLIETFSPKVTPEMLDFVDAELLKRVDWTKDGLTILKEIENVYFDRRTEKGRVAKAKKAVFEEAEVAEAHPGGPTPNEEAELRGALEALDQLLKDIGDKQKRQETTQTMRDIIEKSIKGIEDVAATVREEDIAAIPGFESQIFTCDEKIGRLEAELNAVRADRDTWQRALDTAREHRDVKKECEDTIAAKRKELERFPIEEVSDVAPLAARRLELVEGLEAAALARDYETKTERAQKLCEEWEEAERETAELTIFIKKLRKEIPERILKDADVPVEGLSFDGDRVLIGDKSMDNMSTSEQVGIALAIVRRVNRKRKLKLLCLDRAESLDDDTLMEFVQQIKDDEFQYCLTYVTHGDKDRPEGSILIQNGAVKKEEGPRE